jgi:HlyD family secretion protein
LSLTGLSSQPLLKRTLSLLAIAIAVGAGVWGYLLAQSQGKAPVYRFERVERGPIVASVSAAGNLNAVTTVLVGTQVSGQIKELHADFNSVVRRGQVIARIDPATFEAKVKQARADLDAAKHTVLNQEAQVERARAEVGNARSALAEGKAQTARAQVMLADTQRELGRKQALFQRALISKSEYDTAQVAHDAAATLLDAAHAKEESLAGAIDSAQAQLRVAEAMLQTTHSYVEQKEAALSQTQLDLEYTTIRAPVDGVVVSRAVDVGQTVAASLSAPTLFTIARDLTKMQVETNVDEADIGRVRVDGAAKFTVDAFPGHTFKGQIVQVRKAAQIVQSVVTYIVIVAVDNPDGKLLPGMTANVKLIVAEKPSVLKVPNVALRFRPPGGEGKVKDAPKKEASHKDRPKGERAAQRGDGDVPGRVWVLRPDGELHPLALALGLTDGSATEVRGGDLNEGQQIVVGLASGSGGKKSASNSPALRN